CFVPGRFRSSRSTSSSVLWGAKATSTVSPFTLSATTTLPTAGLTLAGLVPRDPRAGKEISETKRASAELKSRSDDLRQKRRNRTGTGVAQGPHEPGR